MANPSGLVLVSGTDSVTTPTVAALQPTGDCELILKVQASIWGNVASIGSIFCNVSNVVAARINMMLTVARDDTASVDQALTFWRSSASGSRSYVSTVAWPATKDAPTWIKVTWDQDNGSSQSETRFYWSEDDNGGDVPTSWTQVGAAVTSADTGAAVTYLKETVGLKVPGGGGTTIWDDGIYMRAIIKDGINGTVVADFRADAPVEPRYRDSTGKIWTLNGSAYSFVEVQ